MKKNDYTISPLILLYWGILLGKILNAKSNQGATTGKNVVEFKFNYAASLQFMRGMYINITILMVVLISLMLTVAYIKRLYRKYKTSKSRTQSDA